MNPNNPVFIVSKGRWESRLTSRAFEEMGVPYYIIVERSEYADYCNVIDNDKILVLPQCYLDDYDTCDDLGASKSKGPGAARNFAWEYSLNTLGAPFHWVLDDNIAAFFRTNRNYQSKVTSGTIFRAAEDFVARYENVAQAGFQYDFFVISKNKMPAVEFNTRIYSCLYIRNDIPYRWRGRYNEDTDLSLRVLKDGWCTVNFIAFSCAKAPTNKMVGGNTEAFYAHEGTSPKSEMIEKLHPDVAKVVWRFSRVHHFVDYKPFKKNKLIKRPGVEIAPGVNNYGMKLIELDLPKRGKR